MKRLLLLTVALFLSCPAQAKVLDIQDLTSDKGIRIWLVEDHSLPVLAISFAFHSGSATDPADKMGVTQLLSNTLDEGAGDMKSEQFQTALRDNAIDLSYDAARDYFSGSVRTLTSHEAEALRLLKLSVNSPRFDAEPVERMKQANLVRIRSSMNESDWIAARLLNDRIYAGHPYANNSGGTLTSIAAMTPADLRAARARHFARDQLVVGIAGDMKPDDAKKMVDDVFGALPNTAKVTTILDSDMPKPGLPVFYAKDMPQTDLSMAWPGIDEHDPDHYAAVVMDYIFGGGGFSSLLMNEVRDVRGLTYGIYSSMSNMDHADRFVVSGSMQPQNVKATVDVVKSIARDMRTKDVPPDAIAAAKDYLTGSLPVHFSSSMSIADTLTMLQMVGRPITALDDYRDKINAVTAADIRLVAERIFATDPQIVLVGGKPDGMDVETVTVLPNTEGSKKK